MDSTMKILPNYIIIISTCVYSLLNFVENIIHYSIGRNIKNKDQAMFEIKFSEKYDFGTDHRIISYIEF